MGTTIAGRTLSSTASQSLDRLRPFASKYNPYAAEAAANDKPQSAPRRSILLRLIRAGGWPREGRAKLEHGPRRGLDHNAGR